VNIVRVIVLAFSISAPILSQSIFIEPVIGLSRLSDAVFYYGDFKNYGANLGIGLAQKYDLYCGIKLMGDNANHSRDGIEYDAEITFKTYVVGTRYYRKISETDMSLRLGFEYSYDSIQESVFYPGFLVNDVNTKLEGNANGYAIEVGLVLNKWKILHLFLGMNYRFGNYNNDKTIFNGETISEDEFDSSIYLRTDNVSGLGFKASVTVYPFRN
jgi:hypothetical protein